MSNSSRCSVYIGNLDERVTDRVLYDILIQAGKVVDLHIPRDRESDKPKGYAFAEYETEEIADYAVRLFTGVVTLYNRTLKFAISGQDKLSQNPPNASILASNSSQKSRHYPGTSNYMEHSQHSVRLSTPSRISDYPSLYSQGEPPPPGVSSHSDGYGSHFNGSNYEYSRRSFGSALDSNGRHKLRR